MILGLNHINIATRKLDETRDFFVQVLGLTEGPRPSVASPGYWLYAGDRAVLHLQSADRTGEERAVLGHLDHAAFDVTDYAATRRRLTELGVPFREFLGETRGQLVLSDPNGVKIELGGPLG